MTSSLSFLRQTSILLFSNLCLTPEIFCSRYIPEVTITPSYLDRKPDFAKRVSRRFSEKRQKVLISDTLKQIPGVSVTSLGSSNLQTYSTVRGTNTEHTSVRIFDMEINDVANGGRFDFSNIPASDFNHVEVRNFSSESSIGGVIDINPCQGQGQPAATFDLEGGSYGTRQVHSTLNGTKGKNDYYIGGHFLKSGNSTLRNHRLGNTLADKGTNNTLMTRLGFAVSDVWKIDLFASLNNNEGSINDLSAGLPSKSSDTFKNQRHFLLIRNHFDTFHHRWEHDLTLGMIQSDYKSIYRSTQSDYRNQGQSLKGKYSTRLKFKDQQVLTSLGLTEDQTRQNRLYKQTLRSYYGQITYINNWLHDLILTGQGRLDKHQFFKNHMTYSSSAQYFINPDFDIFIRYGTGFRAPAAFDFYKTSPDSLENLFLRPVKSQNFDAGAEFKITQDLALSAGYFRIHIQDLLTTIRTPSGFYQRVNQERRKIQGMESALNYRIHSSVHLRASYTLTHTRDQTTRSSAIHSPRHRIQSGLDMTFTRNVILFGEISYVTSSKGTDFSLYPSRQVHLPAHTDIRFGGSYKINNHVEFTGRIENVLNRQKETVYGYASRGLGCYLGLKLRS